MADRSEFYFRQKVTAAELTDEFSNLETADEVQLADSITTGIYSGLIVSENTVPDLQVKTALGVAYSRAGERINVPSEQLVDVSQDENGSSTAPTGGNSRVISVFLEFDRVLSDPRTDGNGVNVFFLDSQSFKLVVRQGADAATPGGGAEEAFINTNGSPIDSGLLLLADIIRDNGQTAIPDADIHVFRREFTFNLSTTSYTIQAGSLGETVQLILDELEDHVDGTSTHHEADQIDHTPVSNFVATDVQAALDEIITGTGKEFTGTPVFTSHILTNVIRHRSSGVQTLDILDSAGADNVIVSSNVLAAQELRANSGTTLNFRSAAGADTAIMNALRLDVEQFRIRGGSAISIADSAGSTTAAVVTTGRIVLDESANQEDVGGSPVVHTLYESSIIKGYGSVTMDDGVFSDGPSMGVASTTVTSTRVTITLKDDMAGTNYPVFTTSNDVGFEYVIRTAIAGSFDIHMYDTSTGVQEDPSGTSAKECIFFWMGEQA